MSRKISFASGEFYHLYNRGTDKRIIFTDQHDYERFAKLLFLCNNAAPVDLKLQGETLYDVLKINRSDPLVHIISYCLMPNHFHLLIQEIDQGGISRFMQKMTTGYTMYFNKRNDRTGALFQGVFKSEHANDDRYLKYLIAYIHLNPIKLLEPSWKEIGLSDVERAERYLEAYSYSSYPDYLGINRPQNVLIDRAAAPEYFESSRDLKSEMEEWLSYNQST